MSGLIFCEPDPVLIVSTQSKSNRSPKSVRYLKSKSKKCPKLIKYGLLIAKISQFFSINSVQTGPGPKLMKHSAVRTQTKINNIRHIPDPVQSKYSPMLISAT